jgi:microcystin-dependent protein
VEPSLGYKASGSTTPANFDIGSVIIRPNTAGTTNGVTLSPPSGIASAYGIQLPLLAGSTLPIVMDSSGNQSAAQITGAQIASATITASNLAVTVGVNPAGTIIMFGGTVTPTGYLFCDGSAVSRTTYATLFAAVGTAYGNGDGSTTFNVPQGQGVFMRGVDNGFGNDPDAGISDTVFQVLEVTPEITWVPHKGWQLQSHGHGAAISNTAGGQSDSGSAGSVSPNPPIYAAGDNYIQFTGGNQTNPVNIYVNFYIKT